MPSGHVPSGHRRSAKQALATVEAVKVGSPGLLVLACPTPNEYGLAQRPLSTGSPNLLVLACPTPNEYGLAQLPLSTGSPNLLVLARPTPNEYGLAQPRLMARPTAPHLARHRPRLPGIEASSLPSPR